MKSKLNFVNGCYHSIQLPSKNIMIKIHKIIILPVVVYGNETWSPTLREEYKLKIFENRVLRIFRLINCTLYQMLLE
jgi:hypothetical protein